MYWQALHRTQHPAEGCACARFVDMPLRGDGFANIVRTVPRSEQIGGLTDYQKDRRLVRDVLTGAGCDEAQTMTRGWP